MKRLLIFFAIAAMSLGASAQSLTHHTVLWDSVQREYILHVPDNADTSQPRGMIFMLHGLGNHIDTVEGVVHVADFCRRSGWVCVVPQALDCPIDLGFGIINLEACWNVGMDVSLMGIEFNLNAGIDDEGFLLALMDSLAGRYNIAPDSIFFTGISMGGFMTHRMAIHHGDRIAAAVPISGTISNTLEAELPQHGAHPRIMHIHGTTDPVVTWQGDFHLADMNVNVSHIGMPVEQCVRYWVDYNQCDTVAQTDSLADRCVLYGTLTPADLPAARWSSSRSSAASTPGMATPWPMTWTIPPRCMASAQAGRCPIPIFPWASVSRAGRPRCRSIPTRPAPTRSSRSAARPTTSPSTSTTSKAAV